TLMESYLPREIGPDRNSILRAHLLPERETLFQQQAYPLLITQGQKEHQCQLVECGGNSNLVPQFPENYQAFLVHSTCSGILASLEAHEGQVMKRINNAALIADRKSTRLNSSHQIISYAVFCLKKKK